MNKNKCLMFWQLFITNNVYLLLVLMMNQTKFIFKFYSPTWKCENIYKFKITIFFYEYTFVFSQQNAIAL